MKYNAFSINIDESTSKSSKKKILNIFGSHFVKNFISHFYASLEMTVFNAETVFSPVQDQFMKDDEQFTNKVSVSYDSAA